MNKRSIDSTADLPSAPAPSLFEGNTQPAIVLDGNHEPLERPPENTEQFSSDEPREASDDR